MSQAGYCPLQDVHVLSPRTYEHSLPWQMDFADVMRLRTLTW